jgi:allophanate hydrolase subunit 1
VAIAARQTAVYPLDTPGGWHIIGSTQTVMFDPNRDDPALLSPGDTVRFERVV